MNYGRGYVYNINYHIVCCIKYRRKVINENLHLSLKLILENMAFDNNYKITAFNTDKDHFHILIEATPQHYIPNMIKGMKGVSARLLFKEFPELKARLWKGYLWNPSYFISTVGENIEEQIKEYINKQQIK